MRFSFEPGDGSLTAYDPPAIVVQAFDEEKALAECRALIGRRDEAKGEFTDAILALGQKLIEARRAMPGKVLSGGRESFSPAFLAFVEKCGLASMTATHYMRFARDPAKLESARKRSGVGGVRRRVLKEILEAHKNGYTPDEIFAAIRKELDEAK